MRRYAFSLIELLIVIVIIGVVYTLAIESFAKASDRSKQVTLLNLKEYLQSIPHEKSVKFLCLDDCSSCDIFVDGEIEEGLKGSFDNFLDTSVKVYRYDFYQGMQILTNEIYFNEENIEEDVCFSYTVDKKGIGEQVYIQFNTKVYDYTTYFEKTPVYNSLVDAVDAKEKSNYEVLR
ncbi:MAG: prepilin-type N-terminal cleavage/methylation domain-containing protein [Campylobacterota bacterium]|nr:prepilin-type N-terminal cleavage/methylation domain-containing protein [Campylobacterota bacterium]